MSWQNKIDLGLQQRHEAAAYRCRQVNDGANGRWLQTGAQQYLNFSSNDYLGLSQDAAVIAAWQQGAQRYGVGSGGSGHVTGYSLPHAQLEQQLADWLGYPRALLFISGFAANQAVLTALTAADDRILADKLSHASLLEAATHSPAQLRRFAHNQPDSLQKLLNKPCSGQTLVVTEGVFSMDGDSAPLAAIQQHTAAAGGWLLVDDAHGLGVRGAAGRGSCELQGVKPELLVVTFSKAFGLSGAAVLCQEPVAEYLLQYARHLIYSTAMPPAQACALQAALLRIQQGDDLRQRLQQRITQFRCGAAALPLQLGASETAIQPLLVGDNQQTVALAEQLRAAGLWVTAIRPPTVPPGGARLRITLSAAHESEDIDRLLEVLHGVCH
ncbi:8-amino-7-oxononanoate synthase [Yersinia enterocolitica]|uniref:8-amino-7-oxononanoate synthase n=2 Tax=Yersinia enterocolitica TaxID=630 RepID=BIOF_YERE8|nr:8-amino-7-oxononanoate synthase [Yersinia enterocolitica]A1JS67.1 RecName: Full=8-amino-7-oxononanoate synthase; Short=AONS; AltName: Full=7-keto-8-amino-pelargonic acid synthase; Short=7-KAP synthase; Short=KAPA synthase; AltName: Full=8-amino-7-ketopelargonate synthase [Yersinia enterocolitica subsp. enterocolitica 8081]AJI81399.1 8-amino-7-oxononanoate synthase [Yersinia enterocolitica]AJJ24516.1 8-amino-7-oxononanoate synthase [Yersinia enterocolitica]EKA28613.1 8-amino-7-oxononanoate sy